MAIPVRTTEIPREQWVRYCDRFSKQHEGAIVVLEVVGRDLGDQEETNALPLVGISADTKDGESRIEIMLGGRREAHATRIIDPARRMWVEQTDEPSRDSLAIEDGDKRTTLVTFRYVPPDRIDLLLPEPHH